VNCFYFLLIIFFSCLAFASDQPTSVISLSSQECLLVRHNDESLSLSSLLAVAVDRGCKMIRIAEGVWQLQETFIIEQNSVPITIRAHTSAPILSGRSPLILIRKSRNVSFENLVLEGMVEMDQTENVSFSGVTFRRGGVHLTGKKCSQPNECTGYNRRIHVENCTFENCERGIHAERLENSRIEKNRFIGNQAVCDPETIGVELDGSSEDLDRPLELGHSKGNQIVQNSFEQESAIGIRIRNSWANVIRDNHFVRSYRAMEFYKGARHNQILQSYITYLSQQPVSGACPSPCAIYLGAGSVNNIFWNNFFEQNFELQFLETNRNKTHVIDESGEQNVFRSDFLRINR
jgi:Periplasmic copper-binding protein (NosD)